jgi:hypothetical protein
MRSLRCVSIQLSCMERSLQVCCSLQPCACHVPQYAVAINIVASVVMLRAPKNIAYCDSLECRAVCDTMRLWHAGGMAKTFLGGTCLLLKGAQQQPTGTPSEVAGSRVGVTGTIREGTT